MKVIMKYSFIALLVIVWEASGAINLMPEHAVKHPNESLSVTCKDGAGRPVTWQGPRGPLGANTHPKVETASYGTSIIFHKVNAKDTGNYTCTSGKDNKIFTLNVETPLEFMDTSPVQVGREFTDVTLRCEVKGGRKPILTWKVNNGSLDHPKFTIIGDGLLIRNVSKEDSKTYTCIASQEVTGDTLPRQIQLKVEHKPAGVASTGVTWAKSEDAWGFIGGEVNLTCEVLAEPPPIFEWSWNGKKLVHDGRVHNFSGHTHKSILQIHVKDKGVFGSYKCKAKNRIGTLDKTFVLQQGVQPAAPDFIELHGANSDLLDLGIHGPKNVEDVPANLIEGFKVEFKPRNEKHWNDKYFPSNDLNSYPLRDLHHDTEYDVRAATKNKAGFSVYTEVSTFRTLPATSDSGRATNPPWIFLLHIAAAISLQW